MLYREAPYGSLCSFHNMATFQVRQLKSAKAEKAAVDAEVKTLLALKADFKKTTGQDWKPGMTLPAAPAPAGDAPASGSGSAADLQAQIDTQGAKVRDLKSKKAAKAEIDAEVASLLALKKAFKDLTGQDPAASGGGRAPKKPAAEKKADEKKPVEKKAAERKPAASEDGGPKKQTRLCIEAKKEEALSDWYSQVSPATHVHRCRFISMTPLSPIIIIIRSVTRIQCCQFTGATRDQQGNQAAPGISGVSLIGLRVHHHQTSV